MLVKGGLRAWLAGLDEQRQKHDDGGVITWNKSTSIPSHFTRSNPPPHLQPPPTQGGMFDWTQGTQSRAWLFKSVEELGTSCHPPPSTPPSFLTPFPHHNTAELRAKAHRLAKEGIREGDDVPMPRSFASRLSTEGKGGSSSSSSSTSGRPPPHPTTTAGVKRPRPDDEDDKASTDKKRVPTAELEALTAEDEEALLQYFGYMIQDSCGHRSESIKRGLHVQATALTFFYRFFLSNSMLDFDPKVVLMACMFLAGKVEYDYIRLSELKDVFGEKYGRHIIEFEGRLLQGLGFCLKTFHPYNPFFGLVNGLENVNHVKKLGLAAADLSRLFAAGQETIDLLLPTDLPLLHAPARIALAVLVVCAAELGMVEPVEGYLSYCFEEEDEYTAIMDEVALIRPAVERARRDVPKSLEKRKQSRMEVWKDAMARLKKAARWGTKGEGKKRKKSKGGGDNGSVASMGSSGPEVGGEEG